MTRALVLSALLPIGALSLAVAGLQGQPPTNTSKVEKYKDYRADAKRVRANVQAIHDELDRGR